MECWLAPLTLQAVQPKRFLGNLGRSRTPPGSPGQCRAPQSRLMVLMVAAEQKPQLWERREEGLCVGFTLGPVVGGQLARQCLDPILAASIQTLTLHLEPLDRSCPSSDNTHLSVNY